MESQRPQPSLFPLFQLPIELRRQVYDQLIHAATVPYHSHTFSGSAGCIDVTNHLHIKLVITPSGSLSVKYMNLRFPSGLLYASSQAYVEFSQQIYLQTHGLSFEGDFILKGDKDKLDRIMAFIAERPWIGQNVRFIDITVKNESPHCMTGLLERRNRIRLRYFSQLLPAEEAGVRDHSQMGTIVELLKWESFRRLQSVVICPYGASLSAVWKYPFASLGKLPSLDMDASSEGVEVDKPKRKVKIWLWLGLSAHIPVPEERVANELIFDNWDRAPKIETFILSKEPDWCWVKYDQAKIDLRYLMVRLVDMVKAMEDQKEQRE